MVTLRGSTESFEQDAYKVSLLTLVTSLMGRAVSAVSITLAVTPAGSLATPSWRVSSLIVMPTQESAVEVAELLNRLNAEQLGHHLGESVESKEEALVEPLIEASAAVGTGSDNTTLIIAVSTSIGVVLIGCLVFFGFVRYLQRTRQASQDGNARPVGVEMVTSTLDPHTPTPGAQDDEKFELDAT